MKVHIKEAGGAAGWQMMPQYSLTHSSRYLLYSMAFGVASGIQLRRASCAAKALSPDLEAHHVAGVAPAETVPDNSTDVSVYLNHVSPCATQPSAGASGEPLRL